MRKRLINKFIKKKVEQHCCFCRNNDYAQLDVHRINFDKEINEYVEWNTVVVCANCHRKIHSGQIIINKKYSSTAGTILHFWENGQEKWL